MKIAFLGKGGSGKTTLSTALVNNLHARGMRVLAIDADHNMDLSFNLGADPSRFVGSDPDFIKEYIGVDRADTFAAALEKGRAHGTVFLLEPADPFTAAQTEVVKDGLVLMTAGPHTDRVRSQDACSHSLAAPLKAYLPLLKLKANEAVVMDERAGADPVATGILSGVDLAVIVREPTVHSKRVAEQIVQELMIAQVAHIVVENKVVGPEEDAANMVAAVDGYFEMVGA